MDIRPHTCKKFMCGKETSKAGFADSRTRITRIFYHAQKEKSILFSFFAEICAIFLHFDVDLRILWGIYIKKYEKIKKMLDKGEGLWYTL